MASLPEEPTPPDPPFKTAYLKFQNLEMVELKKDNPEIRIPVAQLQKQVSGKWAKLSKSEKDDFTAEWKAEYDKYMNSRAYANYLEKHEEWTEEVNRIEGKEREKAGKRQKRTEKPTAPPHPCTPYIKFQSEQHRDIRKACPLIQSSDLQALVSDNWAKIPKSEKAAMTAAYKAEIAAHKQSAEYLEYLADLEDWKEEVEEIERVEREKEEKKQHAYEKTAGEKILTRNKRRKINGEDVKKGRGTRSRPRRNGK